MDHESSQQKPHIHPNEPPSNPWGDNGNKSGSDNGFGSWPPRRKSPSSGGGGNNQGNVPPEFTEYIEKLQGFFRRFSGGERRGRKIFIGVLVLAAIWLASGLYRVEEGRVGVELLFGRLYGEVASPGLNYNFPTPIGEVVIVDIQRSRRLSIGTRVGNSDVNLNVNRGASVPQESLMLTKDENIVDLNFTVFWKVGDPKDYLFNVRDPEGTIKIAAESAMREVIGQTPFDRAVTVGRAEIEQSAAALLQDLLDDYDSGTIVEKIDLQKSDPPSEVIDAFNDVQRARQDRDRLRNQAEAYANTIIPEARGQSERMLREAEAYRDRLILEAEGEAVRFEQVLSSYQSDPDVTRRRMYLEAIGNVLSEANKVIVDQEEGTAGFIPFMQLTPQGRGATSNSDQMQPNQ